MNTGKSNSGKEFKLLKNRKYFGWRTVIEKKMISQVQDLRGNKNLSITEISKGTGWGCITIYKVLKEELRYVPYKWLVKVTKGEKMNQN